GRGRVQGIGSQGPGTNQRPERGAARHDSRRVSCASERRDGLIDGVGLDQVERTEAHIQLEGASTGPSEASPRNRVAPAKPPLERRRSRLRDTNATYSGGCARVARATSRTASTILT